MIWQLFKYFGLCFIARSACYVRAHTPKQIAKSVFRVCSCSDYNHFLRRRYRGVDTCLVALVFWHIDFSGSEKNMLDVCLGTVSVGSRSILNPLFCTFFDPWKSTFWRAWRQIDKSVGNAFFGDCSQGIHPLSTGTVLLFASLSLFLFLSVPLSLFVHQIGINSSSRPCRARCI